MDMAFPLSLMDVEEEVKMLEEYKEALTKRLEQVNKRIEVLKR
jgi:ubiquinone biosynthesis protein UbiJ